MSTNITYHPSPLTHAQRSHLRHQPGFTIWLTGLSASGKSTLATNLETRLLSPPYSLSAYRLDGDNIRFGLNADLTFTPSDREENIRRIAHVAALFADSCTVAITSFISPYRQDRQRARELHEAQGLAFVEVWCDASVRECEGRDPKGLYGKARRGEIQGFTGVSEGAPYEEPEEGRVEVRVKTGVEGVGECVERVLAYLEGRGLVARSQGEGKGKVEGMKGEDVEGATRGL
ncbi:MAG: hypothetical protein LQ344_004569 [Seirophora lacunosa]|nr:MAG: hypothetical protein LQ344_004569 [Seirophora lacunosa]